MNGRWSGKGFRLAGLLFLVASWGLLVAQDTEATGFPVVSTATGSNHSLALKSDGTVWAWGSNYYGTLGNGSRTASNVPIQVVDLYGVVAIAAGDGISLALKSDGTVWRWGITGKTYLPPDGWHYYFVSTPEQVVVSVGGPPLTGVVAIAGGAEHFLALKSDGTVWAWGTGVYGQLGNGTSATSTFPVQVVESAGGSPLTGVVAIAGGGNHSLALKSDGTVWAWGTGVYGQLGNGSSGDEVISNVPVQVVESAGGPPLTGVVAIAGGGTHSLALKSDGTVWAWGAGGYGQTGNGTSANSTFPVQVVISAGGPPLAEVVAIAAGEGHSLALKSDGTAWAWGAGGYGQLGSGGTTSSTIPVQVVESVGGPPLAEVVAIAAGGGHSLALKSDGTVWAWGFGGYGQLGNGSSGIGVFSDVPVQSRFTRKVDPPPVSVSARGGHSLIVDSEGTVWESGIITYDWYGDPATFSEVAVQVVVSEGGAPLAEVAEIATGGSHTLALKSDGTVWAWGFGGYGQLGNGTSATSTFPVQVVGSAGGPPLTGIISISAAYSQSLALKSDGTVWAWGYGFLGNGTSATSNVPVQVVESAGGPPLTGVVAIAAGGTHSLALKSDGTVWAWGGNLLGQLGIGSSGYDVSSSVPVQVVESAGGPPLTGVISISAAQYKSLALKSDGTVWAWGGTQIGDGTSPVPVQVPGLTEVVAIVGGENHSLALKSDGTVWAWGINDSGALGNGTSAASNFPVQVVVSVGGPPLAEVVAIAAGGGHSLALKSDKTIWAWGANSYGQFGNGSNTGSNVSVQSFSKWGGGPPPHGAISVSGGRYHSLALKSDGTVLAWGNNSFGELGNGSFTESLFPMRVQSLSGVVGITGAGINSLALKSDGTVWTWGDGGYGQLGNGSSGSGAGSNLPVRVVESADGPPLTGVVAISGGSFYSLALKSDGTVWAWGRNDLGQLGSGSYSQAGNLYPLQVSDLTGIVAIAAGFNHSLALKSDGTVWAWGSNNTGQLGNGNYAGSAIPVQVVESVGGPPLAEVVAIAAGEGHSLALKSDGTVWAWGDNYYGELGGGYFPVGIATNSVIPVQVLESASGPPLNGIVGIVAGRFASVALKSNGTAWTWGGGNLGQLGNGSYTNSATPVQVVESVGGSPLAGIAAIAGGWNHFLALKSNGTLWAWGRGDSGELGNGGKSITPVPVRVADFPSTSMNSPPVANGQSATTAEDTPVDITLSGTDPDGDSLTYAVVTGPANGALSGTAPSLTYTPASDFNGTDSFTFKVNDGKVDSVIATVSITVAAVNDPPIANLGSATTAEDTPVDITLSGTDPDGDSLTYTVVSGTSNGTLSGAAPNLTYTPVANFSGKDSFTFKVNDGSLDSNIATVEIEILSVPDAPVAANDIYSTDEDTPLRVVAPGVLVNDRDADGDTLYAGVGELPRNGSVTLNNDGSFTYTPDPGFSGTDGFTYQVYDQRSIGLAPGLVTITIRPVNDAPVANSQYPTTSEDIPIAIALSGTDPDGDSLTYAVVTGPANGALSGTAPSLTYTPVANFSGKDSFTFKVNDGKADSGPATVSISVTPVNDAPVASGDVYSTIEDTALTVPAPGVLSNDTDPDNGTMTAVLAADPAHGTVTLNPDGSFTYNPDAEFFGTDSFTYRISAGSRQSGIVVVTITVVPDSPGDTPPGGNVSVNPVDPTTGGTPATISFGDVTGSGTTTVTTSPNGQPPPTGFRMGNPPTYYEISTTATYAGSVQICITYAEGDYKNEKNLRLMHNTDTNGDGVGDTWIDITDPGYPDIVNNKVCGTTTSLSPFAVIEPTITAPVAPVAITVPVQVGFRFQSIGTGTWSAAWNWGDGYGSNATVSCNSTTGLCEVTGDHVYGAPGVYTVGLSISLDDALYGSDEYKYAVVYDPDGSFVTGGGWIPSPPGAYPAEPALTGKASFGFVSKYKKGATVPSGNTQFQFNAAGMDFVSTSYQWLVISGARAQFKGLGSINGEGAYGFLLTAIDGNVTGGGGSDMFRVKIWDPAASDAIVYDNQQGAMDDATPNTILGGGSIVIHKQ